MKPCQPEAKASTSPFWSSFILSSCCRNSRIAGFCPRLAGSWRV